MQDIISRHIIKAPLLNNNKSSTSNLSKTRIIDITINYIAIDMKESFQIRKVEQGISRWLSLLTTFMIMARPV